MPKLVTWMNNQRVGELTKLANGAHTFKYAPEWLASRYARPLSLSLPLQRGNITSDAVFNFFDNLLPDSPIVRDRIVKRYHAKSRQPFDLLSEIGRDSVGAVTLLPENETITRPIMAWEQLTEARLEEVLTAYKAEHEILSDFARMIPAALDNVKTSLPTDFPENVVTAVETNVLRLHRRLSREWY
nr:type II toxin-antitoxin system HipA family toxin [Escherichia coli]